ncbi:MAG: ABC transporter permease, partial [Lachnospiraceae bacterium]|nr:ABC transporter permease [Lachnospiraceae bacterium]
MNEKKKITSIIGGDKIVLIVAIIAVFALFTSLNKNFLTMQNMTNLLVASSLVGMVAIGHTYLIIAKQNDLSPGSLAAFCGVLGAILLNRNLPIPIAMLVTMCAGAAVGLFNSWMVNQIKIEAFIATLVSQTIIRGFAYIICGGKPVAIKNQTFNKLGTFRILALPIPVWVMIICILIFGFILARTRFGRSVYAIGGSAEAARLAQADEFVRSFPDGY